ncbi:FGGY-family carbohydrate kinase [Flagellimonas sp. CMM7]|nr:FGGY family carbohydrate kinase [Flagellimonas sp. CMM7]UII81890.1 carbohydrate kinase [Flagellimonas sp. CMM7]
MAKKKVTAVFDIGKTNKKFFLFDENYDEVHREYRQFENKFDNENHPCENLEELRIWLKGIFETITSLDEFDVQALNFSTYGASLVHLDEHGSPLLPMYNYTKPLPEEVTKRFFAKYGPKKKLLATTGADNAGLLNSGMQLFWLKYFKPEVFEKIKVSLHLPQYISYVFTGIPVSEYTSLGCHTLLWDYQKRDYHDWVYQEGFHNMLAPLVPSETSINMNYNGKRIKVGVGIHDSSAALLPYIKGAKEKFVLVSTGTWSIAFNPFVEGHLSERDVENGCINYMRINGKPVMASRIFLGNEYKLQVDFLNKHFETEKDRHKKVKFDFNTFFEINKDFVHLFKWKSFSVENMPEETTIPYDTFEHAYHHLMMELTLIQVKFIKKVMDERVIDNLYIDGGFSDNDIYVKLLAHYMRNAKVMTTDSALGSSIGAVIAISDQQLNTKFLRKNYALKKHVPFVIK